MNRRWIGGGCALLLVLGQALAPAQEDGERQAEATAGDEPRSTGLVEETGRRLIQLDLSVSGPEDAIDDLTSADFELAVGGNPIESFTVDNLCIPTGSPEPTPSAPADAETDATVEAQTPPTPVRPRPTYLFYFDQNHLTIQGRFRSGEMASDLVNRLITGGTRGTVVSNGRDLRTFADLTDDPAVLLDAIKTMQEDTQHWWDPTLDPEETRIVEVIERLDDDVNSALSLARIYAAEERWRTEKSLSLFSMVLARMADLDPPRAVIYFADNMRANAGEHYLSYFGGASSGASEVSTTNSALTSAHSFERLLMEANAMGIRFYTVQAEGLVDAANPSRFANHRPGQSFERFAGNTQRIGDAQDSLVGMALETGGRHFLNGVKSSKIARDIESDLSCLYLISFDPVGLRKDSALPVRLRTLRPKVKIRVRGRVVVQSESKRLTSRLLSAFAAPDSVDSEFPVHGSVIPTGFKDGRYTALVQVFVPGSPLSSTSWDLGLSLVSRGEVREDASGRIAVNGPGMPVIFEAEMSIKPGPFQIVAVAHETTGDQIATGRIDGNWPDPDAAPATVGPIALLQPEAGAFLRESDTRREGSVGLPIERTALPDKDTALVGIVCRGKSTRRKLVVERKLVGASSVDFPTEAIDFGDDRCAMFSDLINAGVMTPGSFRYEVRVKQAGQPVASGTRHFTVLPASGSAELADLLGS